MEVPADAVWRAAFATTLHGENYAKFENK